MTDEARNFKTPPNVDGQGRPLHSTPVEGVEVWQNPKNRFLVFQLHYSANPSKKDPSYRDSIKSSMPYRQYMQEYELQWDSFIGLPVYGDFDPSVHVVDGPIEPEIGLPLLRGWDFGLTPAAVIGQLQGDRLCILREFVGNNIGIERFSDYVFSQCAVLYPEYATQAAGGWRDYIDPAGFARKDTDERTCAQVLSGKGIRPLPGPVVWEARKQAVEHFLIRRKKGASSCFSVSAPHCGVLIRGFQGGYRYPEKSAEVEPLKLRPIKDEYSHPHDALQYLAHGVRGLLDQSNRVTEIARPYYSFTSQKKSTSSLLNGGPPHGPKGFNKEPLGPPKALEYGDDS